MSTQAEPPPNLVPVITAAAMVYMSPSEVIDLIADGHARGQRIRGAWYVCIDDLHNCRENVLAEAALRGMASAGLIPPPS